MKYRFIAIEGNIGAGKSTLASKLAAHFRADLLEESFEENPLLPAFYKDPLTFAYPLEVSFLMDRFRDLKRRGPGSGPLIADYWIHKSLIFAKTNLKKEQWLRFEELFHSIEPLLPEPDLILYYHRSVEKVKTGIRERGREFEQDIHDKYLLKLEKNYLQYLKKNRKIPVLWLNGEGFQPGRNREHFQQLLKVLEGSFRGGLNKPELGA